MACIEPCLHKRTCASINVRAGCVNKCLGAAVFVHIRKGLEVLFPIVNRLEV